MMITLITQLKISLTESIMNLKPKYEKQQNLGKDVFWPISTYLIRLLCPNWNI